MGSRQTLILGIIAAVAGIAWGHLRNEEDPRRRTLALLQGLEWFVAVGGAAAAIEVIRDAMEDEELEVTERVTHTRQTVVDKAGSLFSR